MLQRYDVVVVGAGHAGNEAAAAAANLGASVLLITMNMGVIGSMSCNPAMGGIAKGQIVREIDALGGYSGLVSDRSAMQFRMLNKSKGPAMWSPRTQNDRQRFAEAWRSMLEETPNVDFWQDMVTEVLIDGDRVHGVKTSMGLEIETRSVVLTSGTFLNGKIHIGLKQFGGGRAGEKAAHGITEQLVALGFDHGRMKTGTPPRVDGRSIDYSKMEEQPGDDDPQTFSFLETTPISKQHSCHIAYTSTATHDLLREGFDQSPMFSGKISGQGPRYCPSIEDKIERFAERDRHQLFVEPEGWNTIETYINGFSTSLPEEVQMRALRSIPGFENAKIFRPGYAIEYDYFPPTQLKHNLETKLVNGLFFAGQINGTTGYEEAACQGLMAGINAQRYVAEASPFILKRSEGYIGVLIDDLITKGTKEPYRMFTSRAEYRILLRQDNADARLTPLSHSLGLATDARMQQLDAKQSSIKAWRKRIGKASVEPTAVNPFLQDLGSAPLKQKIKADQLLSRPHVHLKDMMFHVEPLHTALEEDQPNRYVLEQVEILTKYEGYIQKEQEMASKIEQLDTLTIPADFAYEQYEAISSEGREKLNDIRPATIGQASRISGVSASDISVLLVHLGR
ncbi:MAG: tRNA uridine-5-carboxymethylaminomethyl(34) synthesis enzyme MnmG [Flavobacteriales bacterium]